MSNLAVTKHVNPQEPEARYFVIDGTTLLLNPLLFHNDQEAAQNGCPIAATLFIKGATRIGVYGDFDTRQNVIVVYMPSPEDWTKKTGGDGRVALSHNGGQARISNGQNPTVEDFILQYIRQQVVEFKNPLTEEQAEEITIDKLRRDLEKIRPEIIEKHGGDLRVIGWDRSTGTITFQFSGACVNKCPASQSMTAGPIIGQMRNMNPGIQGVITVNGPGLG